MLDILSRFFEIRTGQYIGNMEGVYIAGGAVTSAFSDAPVADLDFYFADERASARFLSFAKNQGYLQTYATKNAITMKAQNSDLTIQLITRFYGTPEEIIRGFDFTVCQGAYICRDNKFVLGNAFLEDIASRRLVYTNTSHYPICALYRTKKYQQKGYSLSGMTMVAIALAIHRLRIQTYADLKDQLMGIDTSIFSDLTEKFDDNKMFEADEFIQEFDIFFNDIES